MSFTGETRERTRPVLPLASMVDIMFLLLIFFITASWVQEQDQYIDVTIPATESGQAATQSAAPIIITIDQNNKISYGGFERTLGELRQALTNLAKDDPDRPVVIRGDRASRLELAVKVLDTAYASKMRNVLLATTKTAAEAERVP